MMIEFGGDYLPFGLHMVSPCPEHSYMSGTSAHIQSRFSNDVLACLKGPADRANTSWTLDEACRN